MADEIRNGGSKVRVVRLFGQRDDAGAWQIRDFLKRSVVEFQWIELSTEEDFCRELGLSDLRNVNLPVVELPDGTRLFGPTLRDVADRLGFVTKPKLRQYDVSIYGAGPAGLSAAVYAASEGLSTVLIERSAVGGQAGTTSMIENYMGFPQGINGADLAERAPAAGGEVRRRAFDDAGGREIDVPRRSHLDRPRRRRDDGGPHQCLRHRRGVASSQLPNEDKLLGRGLYYGAGASEAPLCGGEDVHVVGGGNSAGDVLGQGGREPRLADTRLAGDQNHSSFAALRLLPTADKQLDFLVTPDEGNFWPPLSDYNNDCPWPADLTIESCPVGSATE